MCAFIDVISLVSGTHALIADEKVAAGQNHTSHSLGALKNSTQHLMIEILKAVTRPFEEEHASPSKRNS